MSCGSGVETASILGHMDPSAADVRAALDRVLGAGGFANADRLSRLLRYLVEETLSGRAERLKEYVVGVEVFDRPDGYDPRTDSIVRVEARRLRAKLEEYYRGSGAADDVLIEIPRGGYTPVFRRRVVVLTDAAVPAAPAGFAGSWRSRGVIAAAVGALVVITIVIAASRAAPPGVSADTSSTATVRIAVMPFEVFTMDPEVAVTAARVTDAVTAELARLDTVSVVSRTSAEAAARGGQPVGEIARTLGADFIMEGSVAVGARRTEDQSALHQVTVSVRLVDTAVDRKIWVGEYESQPGALAALHSRIAREAAKLASTHVRQRQQ